MLRQHLGLFPKSLFREQQQPLFFNIICFASDAACSAEWDLHWNTPLQSALGRDGAARSTEINVAARLQHLEMKAFHQAK